METNAMFMGTYNHSIDGKGRIIVPVKLREGLGERFVVTRGMDGCLFAYPRTAWERFVDNLKSNVPDHADGRRFKRFFLSGASECELDKQGRVLIPSHLRDEAGLVKEVVFLGMMDRVEIWSKEDWEEADHYEDVNDVSEEMAKYDIRF